jgi:shikimate dehydrogenase
MKRFGLVGYPLGHSFSKLYFERKFEKMGISSTHKYELLEVEYLKDFPALWDRYEDLQGVNVTVPHKINIMRFLDRLDSSAQKVEAVNVVKREGGKLIGYNSDIYGFKQSLQNWLTDVPSVPSEALILGTGGSSQAVQIALMELGVDFQTVSRRADQGDMMYTALERDENIVSSHKLIINTTPVGMHPKVDDAPPIPYDQITSEHLMFDLVYNPEETVFMKEGIAKGAKVSNGLEMLYLQAEKSWEIWTD